MNQPRHAQQLQTGVLRRSWQCCALVCCCLLCGPGLVTAQETMFVGDFLLQEDQWDHWLENQTELQIEGRYDSITGKILKLQECQINFHAKASVRFSSSPNESRQVRLIGLLKPHGDTVEFSVSQYVHLPRLLKQVERRLQEAPDASEATLYHLAEKVRTQGEFYEDPALLSEAEALLKRAIQRERENIIGDNPEALLKLAQKSKELGAPIEDWLPMLHESLRMKYDQIKESTDNQDEFQELIERLSNLPGARVELSPFDSALEKQYRQNPIKIYLKADPFTRLEFNRLFYIEVREQNILSGLKVDQSNGVQIAAELVSFLPERAGTDQVQKLKLAGLDFKLQHIETATRSEMYDLWDMFWKLKQQEKANAVAARWIKKREERIFQEGPAGAPELADDIMQYLNDKPRAAKLLQAAIKEAPDSLELAGRLEKLGFIKLEQQWINEKEYRQQLERDPIRKAMRQGVVIEGMKLDQVQRTLGTPIQHVMAASKSSVTEVWIYPQGNDKYLSVFFEREPNQPRLESEVTKIAQPD